MEEKQQLEEQMRAVMDKYKYKRRQIRELQEDLQVRYVLSSHAGIPYNARLLLQIVFWRLHAVLRMYISW